MRVFKQFIAVLHIGETLPHIWRNLLDPNTGAVLWRNSLTPVCLSLAFTDAKLAEQDKHIPLEGFGENGIEEWIGTGVKWVEEDQQDFGIGNGDERLVHKGRQSVERDWGHAHEISEDQHSHPFGNSGVFVPWIVVRISDCDVDLHVTGADDDKGNDIEQQNEDNVRQGKRGLGVHGQADADLGIAAYSHQREQSEQEAANPAPQHDDVGVPEADLAVQVHCKGDGIPALQGDDRQGVHRQLAGKDSEEASRVAARARLPVNGMVVVLGLSVEVYGGDEEQIQPHAEVCEGQVAHEEAWHGQLVVAREEDDQDEDVAQESQQTHKPHHNSQGLVAHDVLTGVELIRLGGTHHVLTPATHGIVVVAVKGLQGLLLGVFELLAKTNDLIFLLLKEDVVMRVAVGILELGVLLVPGTAIT